MQPADVPPVQSALSSRGTFVSRKSCPACKRRLAYPPPSLLHHREEGARPRGEAASECAMVRGTRRKRPIKGPCIACPVQQSVWDIPRPSRCPAFVGVRLDSPTPPPPISLRVPSASPQRNPVSGSWGAAALVQLSTASVCFGWPSPGWASPSLRDVKIDLLFGEECALADPVPRIFGPE